MGLPGITAGLVDITAPVDIMGPGITTATTGMGIRITLALPSAQDGADGDRDGGARLLTPIILLIPIMPRLLSFSSNSRSSMSSRIKGNQITGIIAKIPRVTTPTLIPARADG
jgi:hypothetical protein